MHTLIRTPLAFVNSSESTRFISLTAQPLRRLSPLRSLAFISLLSNPPSTQALRRIRSPCAGEMDSTPLSSSGIDDFVHVDGDGALEDSNFQPQGSEESVVVDSASDGAVSGEVESRGYQRKVLPEELSKSVVMLNCESSAEGGTCDVYLLGTAHVSAESCQEVQAAINFLKPQAVFLELCSSRVAILTPRDLKIPTMAEMVDMWKKQHNLFAILYSWLLAKVGSKLDALPGAEFRVAYEEAMKYGGKVILGDRPIEVTLRRTWAKMPLWHKTKLVYSLMFQALFLPSPEDLNKMLKEMDDVDMLTLVIQEMSKEFPTLMETLVHERDQYMSSRLHAVACKHNSVMAVVGKGHLIGMQKHWQKPIELRELLTMPSKKPAVPVKKILTTLGVAVAGAAILSGIYFSTKK